MSQYTTYKLFINIVIINLIFKDRKSAASSIDDD